MAAALHQTSSLKSTLDLASCTTLAALEALRCPRRASVLWLRDQGWGRRSECQPGAGSTPGHHVISGREAGGVRAIMGTGRQEREKAGPGQESVWDYPRPPRLEPVAERIRVEFNSKTIIDTTRAFRVLETSHPPVYYFPQQDIKMEYVKRAPGSSFCEWKGNATYWTVSVDGRTASKVGWSYEQPTSQFAAIKSYIALYAGPMDACYVGDERAEPQPGGFYGGWVTSKVVGPFKGGPGSWGW